MVYPFTVLNMLSVDKVPAVVEPLVQPPEPPDEAPVPPLLAVAHAEDWYPKPPAPPPFARKMTLVSEMVVSSPGLPALPTAEAMAPPFPTVMV
jgi:hypothetical protein